MRQQSNDVSKVEKGGGTSMGQILNDDEARARLALIARYHDLAIPVRQAERDIVAHAAKGAPLPLFRHPETGAEQEYEVVIRTGRCREWRSETVAAAILDAMNFDVSKFMEAPRLKSVAQVVKVTGWQALEGLWIHPNRGVAVLPTGSGFARAEFAKP
jgi:hypothetical protein